MSKFQHSIRSLSNYNNNNNRNILRNNNDSSDILTRRFLSSSAGNDGIGQIRQVGKMELQEILSDIESDGREGSEVVVIDVRGDDEILFTGKLSKHVHTIPLPLIAQMGVFNMESDDFEDAFGFAKPTPDETIVFTCKAGIRSMHAAQFASRCGYTKIINYSGGSDEWFNWNCIKSDIRVGDLFTGIETGVPARLNPRPS